MFVKGTKASFYETGLCICEVGFHFTANVLPSSMSSLEDKNGTCLIGIQISVHGVLLFGYLAGAMIFGN